MILMIMIKIIPVKIFIFPQLFIKVMEIVHSLSLGTFKRQFSEDLERTLWLERQDQVDG